MAKPKDKQPWFKFYPQDWRGDAKLRMCSIGARGLWAEMLCVMHEAEPYGYLLNNGKNVTSRQMAALAGISVAECMKFMLELASAGVYSIDDNKVIFSRRMVRDKAKIDKDRANGKNGGNPALKGCDNVGVNPDDKAQKPEATSKAKATSAAAEDLTPDQERQVVALKALVVGIRSAAGLSIPNMDHLRAWIASGIAQGTILSSITPILKRKQDMVSLSYCDGAVRDAHAAIPHLQVVTAKLYWIDEGTQEWSCWQSVYNNGRGSPVRDQRDSDGKLTGRRGWEFPSQWPPGFNDFGERIAPSNAEENAA
jgi:hypothetical protein